MVNKTKASVMCLVLTHLCLAGIGARNLCSEILVTGAYPVAQTMTSPEACVSKIEQLMETVYRQAGESGREVDVKDLDRQKAEIASKCVASLSINSVTQEQLFALAKLYFEAHQQSQADAAIGRYLQNPQASAVDKTKLLRMAMDVSLYYAADADKSRLAENYLARLDQLGPAVIRQRISAHLDLAGHYLSGKEDSKAFRHEIEIANLSKALPAAEQQAALDETISAIDSLALFNCSTAGVARSRAIIEQLPSDLVRLAHAEERVGAILSRYLMAGQEAPQLFPRSVLNAPASEGSAAAHKGHVTVMLFAAYWCGPCHAIYPEVIDVQRRFRDNGVEVLLVTQLSNPTDDPKAPNPQEELARIQKFYVEEMKLPFPIVIEGPADRKSSGDKRMDQQRANRQWSLFSFYPMTLVIDKKGRTRALLMGTLPGQGDRLRAKIEELLKEAA